MIRSTAQRHYEILKQKSPFIIINDGEYVYTVDYVNWLEEQYQELDEIHKEL